MNVPKVSYQPKIISNNQNKRNQSVSFKAGEGDSLVGLFKENGGNPSQEQLDLFINENFSPLTRRSSIKDLLAAPSKYIAGLTATIANLTSVNKELEEKNKELSDKKATLQQRVNYFVDTTQRNNIDVKLTVDEKKYAEMQKVRSVLSELKIPYAVDKDDNEGLLTIDTSTLAKVIEKKDEIVKKMGKEINFYDYVGTINGNVKIPPYSNIDLGNVHTINGDLTMKGDFTDGNTRCNAKKLTYINGSLLLEFKNILKAPLLKRIEKDCKMIDSYLTSSNLEYVGGDMYLTGDHLRYLHDGNHRDFSNLNYAKSIKYMNVSPTFSFSLECDNIEELVQGFHTDDFFEDD